MFIKPLSVNRKYCIKKVKKKSGDVVQRIGDTPVFAAYCEELYYRLPVLKFPNKKAKYGLIVKFGFSNVDADIDNPVKPLQDQIQKKYKINDAQIYHLYVEKCIVPKGQEFIEFDLVELKE